MKKQPHYKYNQRVFGTLSATFLSISLFVYCIDPYWLFHRKPVWDGHNIVLALKMRFTKSLQVIFRQPRVVIIGSSRVYRGIPTNKLPQYNAYNLGISSLRISEADAYVRHVMRWTPVKVIVLGLDYFMFDHAHQSEPGFDSSVTNFNYLFKAIPSSLLTLMAVKDSLTAMEGEKKSDGHWTWSGFKITKPRPAERMEVVVNTFYNDHKEVTDQELNKLENIIRQTRLKGIELKLFISPLNQRMINRMKKMGVYEEFERWKAMISEVARSNNVKILDFSKNNPFFIDHTEHGSSTHWIDPSHYSPKTGLWILTQTGFLVAHKNQNN